MHVRATARTNGVASAQVTPLGHGASREIHSRAERRRRSASEARFSSTTFGVELDHRPCADAKAACGIPVCQRMRAPRARLFAQSFRTPLKGEKGTGRTGKPWGRSEHGAMTRARSLDEAKRNPGLSQRMGIPDFAALHPGYEVRVGLFDT